VKRTPTISLVCLLLALPTLAWTDDGQAGEVRAVEELDLEKYAGRWYEIARLPNRFQNDCASDVTATYELREDGRIDVINRCLRKNGEPMSATGVARLASKDGPASELKVRFAPSFLTFLPFVWADYWVIDLAHDYSYAVVGHPNRDYLWVLSRTPQMVDDLYEEIIGRAGEQGFQVDRLVMTLQSQPDGPPSSTRLGPRG
jgi:apolipoprotein D and lipocalin family protein